MSTVVLRSEDALKSRFHANAFGYRPQPPMNPHRRKPPPPPRPAAAAAAPPSPPSQKPNRAAPARTGRKPRPAAGAADELRHHRRGLVMGEVTILKRGEAMKPSAPVPPGSSVGDVPNDLNRSKLGFPAVDPVFAGPGYCVTSPAPSSLPYPGFLLKPLAASEEATRSLLRLLRLNQFAP